MVFNGISWICCFILIISCICVLWYFLNLLFCYVHCIYSYISWKNFFTKAFAHTLQELVEENPEENKYRMREIQRLQAFFLFGQHNFEKSLEIYTKIDAGVCIHAWNILNNICIIICISLGHFFVLRERWSYSRTVEFIWGQAVGVSLPCIVNYLS